VTRIAAAITTRLLLTVPLSWVAYWILMPAFVCIKVHSVTASCFGKIPLLVASAVALPIFAGTYADSDDPLMEIYLPVVTLALASATVWAWRSGAFRSHRLK
jgi:hypothetical protein